MDPEDLEDADEAEEFGDFDDLDEELVVEESGTCSVYFFLFYSLTIR